MLLFRRIWADYFDDNNIQYAFYSAANVAASQQERRVQEAAQEDPGLAQPVEAHEMEHLSPSGIRGHAIPATSDEESDSDSMHDQISDDGEDAAYFSAEEDTADEHDPRTEILSATELEELFLKVAPNLSGE